MKSRYPSRDSNVANNANVGNVVNVVAQQMTLEDAMQAQFDLSCSDCITAFVSDEIIYADNVAYLKELSETIAQSTEFDSVSITIQSIPMTMVGRQFAGQFLGWRSVMRSP